MAVWLLILRPLPVYFLCMVMYIITNANNSINNNKLIIIIIIIIIKKKNLSCTRLHIRDAFTTNRKLTTWQMKTKHFDIWLEK